jgi:hypothetical protein
LNEFLKRKFYEKNVLFHKKWGNCAMQNHRVTLGACYHQVGSHIEPCSEEHCCATWLRVCYDINGLPISITNTSMALYPNGSDYPHNCSTAPLDCPDGFVRCDTNLLFKSYQELLCDDLPCNTGPWENWVGVAQLNECPGCTVDAYFWKRTTTNCEPNYTDYKVQWVIPTDSCHLCYDDLTIFQTGLAFILKYMPVIQLDENECDTTFRFLHADCWVVSDDGVFGVCDYVNGCCWSRYSVCKINGERVFTLLDGSIPNETTCLSTTRPCFFTCEFPIIPKIPFHEGIDLKFTPIDYLHISPNPVNDNISLLFNSLRTGKIKIEILDFLGNIQ